MATILIVDDDPSYRTLLVLLLERAGHAILEAENGESALEVLRGSRVDLVVTDLFMPVRDGIEMLADVRQMPVRPPVIVVSGQITGRDSVYARAVRHLGAVRAIDKNDVVRELPLAVEKILARRAGGPHDAEPSAAAEHEQPTRPRKPRDRFRQMCLASVALVLLGLAGVLRAGPASAEQVTFVVGEWAPFVTRSRPDLGNHTKRVAEVFARAGIDAVFEFMPWKRAFELTRAGDAVATFPWASTPERRAAFLYSRVPLATELGFFFYRKDRFPSGLTVASFEDVQAAGLSMVGVTSYWYEETVRRIGIDYHAVAGSALAWRYLDVGRADILLENRLVADQEVPAALGAGRIDDFASAGPIHETQYFILFSASHEHGERLRDAWDQIAAID